MRKHLGTTSLFLSLALSLSVSPLYAKDRKEAIKVSNAVAVLQSASGSDVRGTLQLENHGEKVLIKGKVTGLTPGAHGFHIHEFGDCSKDDATSAGGHYNPGEKSHAGPGHDMRHVGDLGNIEADEKGVAFIDIKDTHVKLNGKRSVVGRAFIVHAGKDDLSSQPSGAAGKRVACGVIGISKP